MPAASPGALQPARPFAPERDNDSGGRLPQAPERRNLRGHSLRSASTIQVEACRKARSAATYAAIPSGARQRFRWKPAASPGAPQPTRPFPPERDGARGLSPRSASTIQVEACRKPRSATTCHAGHASARRAAPRARAVPPRGGSEAARAASLRGATSSATSPRAGPGTCRRGRGSWFRTLRRFRRTAPGRSPRRRRSWPEAESCC